MIEISALIAPTLLGYVDMYVAYPEWRPVDAEFLVPADPLLLPLLLPFLLPLLVLCCLPFTLTEKFLAVKFAFDL